MEYPEGVFTTEIRQNDEGGFLLYVAYVPADGEPEENPRNEAVVKAICMHVCICMHLGMHTKKARKKPENPYICHLTKTDAAEEKERERHGWRRH